MSPDFKLNVLVTLKQLNNLYVYPLMLNIISNKSN